VPDLQQLWEGTYKPGATGSNGDYADRSYWLATYNWNDLGVELTFPYSREIYNTGTDEAPVYVWDNYGFSNGYVPLFAIIGFNNKVYWDNNDKNFAEALNLAIDEFYRPIYVANPISDKNYTNTFSENIDLNTVFTEAEGNPMTFSVIGNTNPDEVSAIVTDNILTISGTPGDIAESAITVQTVSGENSATDEFIITTYDYMSFTYMENGFESSVFPPPFWEIKYNTEADGGLNGGNLRDPDPLEEKWFQNTPTTDYYGTDYIRTGSYSALIKYWAPDFNWLIMPQMQLDYNDYTLNFWIWYSSSSYETKFHVLVNDGTKGWNSIMNWDSSFPDNTYGSEVSLSLSDYVGKTIRIAFVYEYTDGYEVALDDIRVVSPSGIDNFDRVISGIELHQNYPNPFNPSTKISFTIDGYSPVKLSVLNHKGELVRSIFDGESNRGHHSYDFDASELSSGIYFYKLETQRGISMKKMVMLK
jgi:hypothetical protein